MGPFEITKIMFESPASYAELTKGEKRSNFFIIQRRMAIQYPVLANMLQRNKINQEAAVDVWQRYLRQVQKFTKTPFWMYVQGVKNADTSDELAQTTGILKITPVLERMTLGLYTSVLRSQTNSASTPTPSQVRKIAPRLPGFSSDSKTTTKG